MTGELLRLGDGGAGEGDRVGDHGVELGPAEAQALVGRIAEVVARFPDAASYEPEAIL